jgi:hypothetical protein
MNILFAEWSYKQVRETVRSINPTFHYKLIEDLYNGKLCPELNLYLEICRKLQQ